MPTKSKIKAQNVIVLTQSQCMERIAIGCSLGTIRPKDVEKLIACVKKLYEQKFSTTLIMDMFEGWEKVFKSVFHNKISNTVFVSDCLLVNDKKLPKTLGHFIEDIKRTDAELLWKENVVIEYKLNEIIL